MRILIIGGTSGLGLELARNFRNMPTECNVIITGRDNPHEPGLEFYELDIDSDAEYLAEQLEGLVTYANPFHTVVYNPGFYQQDPISGLSDSEILKMINVGLTGFWDGTSRDTSTFLEPTWVADQILEQLTAFLNSDDRCREIHILREQPRI
jgi:short-subunit dehydrogenase